MTQASIVKTKAKPKYRLKLKSLSFISSVDMPAQETATAAIIKRAGNDEQFSATVRVAKVDDELGIVLGWAFTATVDGEPYHDLQGDAIDENEIVKVAAEYMASGGATDEMHDREPDGRVVFLYPLTAEIAKALEITSSKTGLLVGIKPSVEVLAKFKSGEYTGFSIDGLGSRTSVDSEKRFAKRAVMTTAELGHSHLIGMVDEYMSGCTSSERVYSSVSYDGGYHSHPWIRSDDGTITIGESVGHTHEPIMPAAKRAPGTVTVKNVTYAGSYALTGQQPKESTMPNEKTENEKKLEAELTKARLFGALNDAEKAHVATLDTTDGDTFLAKSATERDAVIAKAAEANPVVFTAADGTEYRKRDDSRLVKMAKERDEDRVTLVKREAELELQKLEKRATTELGNLPKANATKVAVLKALDGIADEAVRKDAQEMLAAANSQFAGVFKTLGHGGGNASTEPKAKFNSELVEFAKSKGKTPVEATGDFVETDRGAELYAEAYPTRSN